MASLKSKISKRSESLKSKLLRVWTRGEVIKKFPFLSNHPFNPLNEPSVLRESHAEYIRSVSTPQMAMSLPTACFIWHLCNTLKFTRILDLGSGFSSYVLRLYASQHAGVIAYSVDDNPEWLKKSEQYLESKQLSTSNLYLWDDFVLSQPQQFDFVFHDLGTMSMRQQVLPFALDISRGGYLLLDDMHYPTYSKYVHLTLNSNDRFQMYDMGDYTIDKFGRYAVLVDSSDRKKSL